MLFKRLHKHLDQDIEEHTEGSEGKQVEHTEEELEAHLQKLMKRQRRIVRLKKAVLYLIVGIGLLGGPCAGAAGHNACSSGERL